MVLICGLWRVGCEPWLPLVVAQWGLLGAGHRAFACGCRQEVAGGGSGGVVALVWVCP
jgi:hypothetical protein